MKVVIVPRAGRGSIYSHNRTWGAQFRDASPTDRARVEMTADDGDAAVAATRSAASQAGADGWVIYATGHGGAAGGSRTDVGSIDLAPGGNFRITQDTVDYTETERSSDDAAIRRAGTLPGARAGESAVRAWCSAEGMTEDAFEFCRDQYVPATRRTVERATRLRADIEDFTAISAVFAASPVARVVFLACSVGGATAFLRRIAAAWNVPIYAYSREVASIEERIGRTTWIRMYLNGDAEGEGTNTDRGRTEMPNPRDPADYFLARPPAAVAAAG